MEQYAYIRVSTKEQNIDRQLLALEQYHIPGNSSGSGRPKASRQPEQKEKSSEGNVSLCRKTSNKSVTAAGKRK